MIEIVAGTPPGGGLDRTARALAKALDEAKAFDVPVVVRNVPGDGARKAWAYMEERRGDGNVVGITSANRTTDRLLGLTAFDHEDYTPIAMLHTEYIAFVVRADSTLGDANDLLERMRVDSASLSVALSTALGNPNHIALARVVRHAGGDPRAPIVRVFDSALDAVGDVVSGKAELAAVTVASTAQALAARKVRILAVSAPARLPGVFAAAPTWKEHGVDCVVGAWRGVAGASGIGESRIAAWEHALKAAVATRSWAAEVERNGWTAIYMEGAAFHGYLDQERREMAAALEELGLIRLDAPYSSRKTHERSV